MKRIPCLILLVLILASGCSRNEPEKEFFQFPDYHAVEPVGTVPEEFRNIVDNNQFRSADAYADRLISCHYVSDKEWLIEMVDFHGNSLAVHPVDIESTSHYVRNVIGTDDGGFLYTICFEDHVNPDGIWASESGVYSKIVRCDKSGDIEWVLTLEDYHSPMLSECFEAEDGFYFFGEQETPETKKLGVVSPTDIHLLKVSKDGTQNQSDIIAGSDYDQVYSAEYKDNVFLLYCSSQSSDGDFKSAGEYCITVDQELKVLSMEPVDDVFMDFRILGYIDGNPIRYSSKTVDNFSDGSIQSIIDYGDFYLIVSSNITGIYENTPPMISSLWYYFETVYGAYDEDGNILWKATVDSSPDYHYIVDNFCQTENS